MKLLCKRFWCLRGSQYCLDGDGFVYDPEAEYGRFANPGMQTLATFSQASCLVLLGEPGLGKTTELKMEYERVWQENLESTIVLKFNLNGYSTDSRICSEIFDSKEVKDWIDSQKLLYLFLDSLDEGRLEVQNIARILGNQLQKFSACRDRLRLRIACRTAEWPLSLEGDFGELWDANGDRQHLIQVLELVPFRRIDVEQLAANAGVDAKALIEQVLTLQIQPFATNPITLNPLLSAFRKTGTLPENRTQIYESGCLELCQEISVSRRESRRMGELSPLQRLEVAARIAAYTIFTGRSSIDLVAPLGSDSNALTVSELAGGLEAVDSFQFSVTEAAVRETLETAMFSGRGEQLLGFAHQTYAEFLAARYIDSHCTDQRQIESLIFHQKSGNHVVPQLAETAAWICTRRKSLLQKFMICSSEIVLRSDVLGAEISTRAALLEAILNGVRTEELPLHRTNVQSHLNKLVYPGIVDFLKPVLLDSSESIDLRDLVIDIAVKGKLTDFVEPLLTVAARQEETDHTRSSAILAVGKLGSRDECQRLVPLLASDLDSDSYDKIRGALLTTIWPHRLVSVEDLFAILKVPQRESYLGVYKLFLMQTLCENLKQEDLPVALKWCSQLTPRVPTYGACHDAIESIVERSINALHVPEILQEFSTFVASRMRSYQRICDVRLFEKIDRNTRMRITENVLRPMEVKNHPDAANILFIEPCLIDSTYLETILHQAVNEPDSQMKAKWAQLAKCMLRPQTADVILRFCELDPLIADMFADDFSSVDLASVRADNMRKLHNDYLALQERLAKIQEVKLLDPPPKTRVLDCLDRIEGGDPSEWVGLNSELQLKETDTDYRLGLEDDLTQLPGWEDAEEQTRIRIVRAALAYLRTWQPNGWRWIGTNQFPYSDTAGYRALVLMSNHDPTALDDLPLNLWREMAPVILGYPMSAGLGHSGEQRQKELAARCFHIAPDEIVDAVRRLIESENSNEGSCQLCSLWRLELCWNEWLCNRLLDLAKSAELRAPLWGDLIETLIRHNHNPSQAYAEQISLRRNDEQSKMYAEQAAIALWCAASGKGWAVLWPEFMRDEAFFRAVMDVVAQDQKITRRSLDDLTERQLAELYRHLERIYPITGDPSRDGVHVLGPRDMAKDYRDQVLRALIARGSIEGVEAIQWLQKEMPHLKFLSGVLVNAKQHMLASTWKPLTEQELRDITQIRSSRLVRNSEELQKVILESLERLQNKLQGENPAVRDIWDKNRKTKTWEPVDENAFSDYVVRHLRDDLKKCGIVSLREVEIRRGNSGPGERTDIYVAATIEGSHDVLRTIIEVKGCWHHELQTAMQTQLKDRYLHENDYDRGVFLVGWFDCNAWNDADSRKSSASNWTIEDARKRFEDQANQISEPGAKLRAFILDSRLK